MKYTLQPTYKSLAKKQKGILIQEIISNPNFKKSKEWLRKYLAGAYKNIDEKVEEIGLNAVKKIGVLPQTFLPFRLIGLELGREVKIVPQSNSPPKQLFNYQKDLFQRIYEDNIDSLSVSKVGQAWLRFGRACRKDLNKTNPFRVITELVIKTEKVKNIEGIEELKTLYEQHIKSTKEYIYMAAWELFSQKSRFVYFLNPFNAIQAIITKKPI